MIDLAEIIAIGNAATSQTFYDMQVMIKGIVEGDIYDLVTTDTSLSQSIGLVQSNINDLVTGVSALAASSNLVPVYDEINLVSTQLQTMNTQLTQNIIENDTRITNNRQEHDNLASWVIGLDNRTKRGERDAANIMSNITTLQGDVQNISSQIGNVLTVLGDNIDILYDTKQDTLTQNTDIHVANIVSGTITVNPVSSELFDGFLTSVDTGGNIIFEPINSNTNVAIKSLDGAIAASKFITLSDERVKRDIVPMESSGAVDKMMPVRYKYKNAMFHDDHEHLGFIAQDLREIDPRFVCSQRGRIPNISKVCVYEKCALVMDTNGMEIDTGTVLEVYAGGRTFEVRIAGITPSKLLLSEPLPVPYGSECFVIGTVVDDVLAIDSMAIIAEIVSDQKLYQKRIENLEVQMKRIEKILPDFK